jgi:hypothetical protein
MKAIIALVLVLSLAACGGGGNGGGGGGASMTDVAKQFIEATFKADKEAWQAAACEAIKAQADSMTGGTGMPEGVTYDFSALKYEVKEESGDTGKVGISGVMKLTVAGQTQEMDFASNPLAEVPMKKEGGNWKVCPNIS